MSRLATTYSHAAPYIRLRVLNAASLKLSAKTQRNQRQYSGQMFGLINALDILLNSPEGKDSPVGYADYNEYNKKAVLAEVERYVGGEDRMRELGFTK